MKFLFSIILAFAAATAQADTFSFTYTGDTNNAYGLIDAQDIGGGQFLASSGSLTVTTGDVIGQYSLIPGGPVAFLSPTETFLVDNVVAPHEVSAFTYGGVLFGDGAREINIYSVGAGQFKFDFFNGSSNTIDQTTGAVTISAVPEPETYALLLAGVLMVWFIYRNRRA